MAPAGLMLKAVVPWPFRVPAPGASNIVMVPSGARTKPCRTVPPSEQEPVIAPAGLMLVGPVSMHAPPALNLVNLPLEDLTKPWDTEFTFRPEKTPVMAPAGLMLKAYVWAALGTRNVVNLPLGFRTKLRGETRPRAR